MTSPVLHYRSTNNRFFNNVFLEEKQDPNKFRILQHADIYI